MAAVGCPRAKAALLRGPQALLAQKPPDPVFAAALADFFRIGAHVQRPAGFAAARETPGDERAQHGIALAPRPPELVAVRVKTTSIASASAPAG